jgi:pilus assembly protein Flp/PilA
MQSQPQITRSICIPKGVNNYMLMTYFQSLLAHLSRDEKGQTAVEYGLVLALIAVVLVVALAGGLGGVITTILGDITDALAGA